MGNGFELRRETIVRDLRDLGVGEGDVVLVHSSLSSIGYVPGGAETVVDVLLEAVGQEGTVLVPTITGQIFNSPENPPKFSLDQPTWTGIIPETFRKRKEALRSRHPTHSVAAIGSKAKPITEGHENSPSPCGEGTPYVKASRMGGKILFIGATLESNTTFHSVEELARLYYHLQPEPTVCMMNLDGKQIERRMYLHAYGTPRAFGEKEIDLIDAGMAKTGYVGRARSLLVDAEGMIEYALRRLKKDRLYLVDRRSVDAWSILRSVRLVSEGHFASIKISLYLPPGSILRFHNDLVEIRGVQMKVSDSLTFNACSLMLGAKIAKPLRLKGGLNHWIEFSKKGKRVEANLIESARAESLAELNSGENL